MRRSANKTKKSLKRKAGEFDPLAQYQRVGFLLRLAQIAVFKDLTAALQPLALRPADMAVLRLIGNNPGANQRSVAEALHIKHPNMVLLIDQLQRRGLLVRTSDAANRRANRLTLTAMGERHLSLGEALDDEHSRKVCKVVGQASLPDFLAALSRLAKFGDKR